MGAGPVRRTCHWLHGYVLCSLHIQQSIWVAVFLMEVKVGMGTAVSSAPALPSPVPRNVEVRPVRWEDLEELIELQVRVPWPLSSL